MKKKIVITCLVLLFLLGVVGNYFYNVSLNANVEEIELETADDNEIKDKSYKENLEWINERKVEIESISVIGTKIYGYKYINPNSDKWIIVVHGYTNTADKMATFIRKFYEMGYNVFAPDLLGHGKSKNAFYTMGHVDSKDLANWATLLSKEYNNADMYLFGVSMGAATVINSLDENLPNNVKAFIEDSGYINLKDQFAFQLKRLYKLPSFPILESASIVARIRAGYFIEEVDATKALENTKLNALILHGDADDVVPVENAYKIAELLKTTKTIHIYKGLKHVKAYFIEENDYWNTIKEFLENN